MIRPNTTPPDHLKERYVSGMNHKGAWNLHEKQLRGEHPRDIRSRKVRQKFCLIIRLEKTHATDGKTSRKSRHHDFPTIPSHQRSNKFGRKTHEFNHPNVANSANQPPITQVQPSDVPSSENSALFSGSLIGPVSECVAEEAVVALSGSGPDSSSYFAEITIVDSPSKRL